jgi:hypothetical protein
MYAVRDNNMQVKFFVEYFGLTCTIKMVDLLLQWDDIDLNTVDNEGKNVIHHVINPQGIQYWILCTLDNDFSN